MNGPAPELARSDAIVVIGASAGGVTAMLELAPKLPPDFPVPIVVVIHIGAYDGHMPDLMNRRGPLPASYAVDGETVRPGRIYFAPPDRHVVLEGPVMRLMRTAKENFARPAIDPLFRSAALRFDGHVIGVVLTGMLDDGAGGLRLIKETGGTAVVQNPDDADSPSMPRAALAAVAADYCVPLSQLAALLTRLAEEPMPAPKKAAARAAQDEFALTLGQGDAFELLNGIGRSSHFTCPECGGSLWELNEASPKRYRCHTGHAYTVRSLESAQDEQANEALWVALRALSEKRSLLAEMADGFGRVGHEAAASAARSLAETAEAASVQLRALLAGLPPSVNAAAPDEPSP